MIRWGAEQDQRARALIDDVVAGGASRLASWRGLMALVAPFLEEWAGANRLLRRCRLAGEDDTRAVMVTVLERLAAGDHANLRAFQRREAVAPAERDDLVESLERLGRLEDEDDDRARSAGDTPVKAWLLRLVDYTARDHVRRRFGWAEAGRGEPTKRDLHSDAAPLDTGAEPGARPPMTDRLTVSKLVAEVQAYMASFPAAMQSALTLWLDDHGFDEIAAELALADADKARALVRAGQARLRERFRGRAPLFA